MGFARFYPVPCPWTSSSQPVDIKLPTGGHQAPNRWTSSSQPVDIKLSTGGHQAPNPWTSSSQPVDIKLPTGGHQAPKVYVTLNFRWGERPREPRELFDALRLAGTLAPPNGYNTGIMHMTNNGSKLVGRAVLCLPNALNNNRRRARSDAPYPNYLSCA